MRWLALLLVLMTSTATVRAQDRLSEHDPGGEARARFQLGQALYGQGQFVEAAAEFERAHQLSGHPAMLFNAFVCYRDAHEIPRAAERLRTYLESGAAEGDEATRLYRTLELLEERAATPVPPDPQPGDPPAAPEPDLDPDLVPGSPPPDEGGSVLGPAILLVVGGALLAGGAVTGVMVLGRDSDLSTRCPEGLCADDPGDEVDSGRTLALVTDGLLLGGIIAASIGLVWWLSSGGEEEAPVRATAACDTRGCGAGLVGTW